jgi:glycosyltransferase involved in cell wall biosynthesis
MRIAQVAPLFESVPPKYYGGTERIVSYLTQEFVRQGHEVTLFASGDSETKAHLVAACRRSLRLDKHCVDQLSHQVLRLEHVFQRAAEFDIVHFHVDYLHFPPSRRQQITHVTTLHGRLDPDLIRLYPEFRDMPVISISNGQREPLPWANWQATVYHGVPADVYQFRAEPRNYLAFLGRISPRNEWSGRLKLPSASRCRLRSLPKWTIVEGLEDAVEAVRRVPELSRKRCREVFEKRFTPREWPTIMCRFTNG